MIYLDNSATTALSESVKKAMITAMECYGNPSSLHAEGLRARKLLIDSRSAVLSALGERCGKLIFTSCGSEASNLVFFGAARAKSRRVAKRIVITDSEHPSVENPSEALVKEGFEVFRIRTKGGRLDEGSVAEALSQPVFLVSLMLVNNETGAVYDVGSVFRAAKAKYPDVICHCDAVQGFLKIPFTPSGIGADAVTLSGHKIHAPKGVGALWISDRMVKEKRFSPLIFGGGQEDGFRSGTENTLEIAGFAAAAREGKASFADDTELMRDLRKYFMSLPELAERGIRINSPETAAPHIISITLPGIRSETILHFLSGKGICVSAGSACSSHSGKPSRALLAFGLTPKEADCTVRASLSRFSTKEDVRALAAALAEASDTLIRR